MTAPSELIPCERCGRVRATKASRGNHCMDCHKLPGRTPRPAPDRVEQLAGYSIKRATDLACLVRDEGRDGIGDYLDRLNTQQLYGLVVALAAMVPVDQSPEALLAWLKGYDALEVAA